MTENPTLNSKAVCRVSKKKKKRKKNAIKKKLWSPGFPEWWAEMKKERWQRGETKKDSIMMTMLEKKEREKNRKALLLEVQTFEDEDDKKIF